MNLSSTAHGKQCRQGSIDRAVLMLSPILLQNVLICVNSDDFFTFSSLPGQEDTHINGIINQSVRRCTKKVHRNFFIGTVVNMCGTLTS